MAGTAPGVCGLRSRLLRLWSQKTPLTEVAASGCGRGAERDPPPLPPPQLPPPPAARAPTRTRTPGLSRAHPFLELPSPPSSPRPAFPDVRTRDAPEACSRPFAPWVPPREPLGARFPGVCPPPFFRRPISCGEGRRAPGVLRRRP